MLLFSPPPCDLPGKPSMFANRRSTLPLWQTNPIPLTPSLARSASAPPLLPPSVLKARPKMQPPPSSQQPEMSRHPSTPRSMPYSPTLNSIPEVFEYEPLDSKLSLSTPPEHQGMPESFVSEHASPAEPTLTRATSRTAIIQSPPRKAVSARAVSKVLRKILEADRARRARIMRIYLKAIVFLKYVWSANERYGNVMVTTGMYMQR